MSLERKMEAGDWRGETGHWNFMAGQHQTPKTIKEMQS